MLGLSLSTGRQASLPWWPGGAVFAADFAQGRAMNGQVALPLASAFGITRSTPKLVLGTDGLYRTVGSDTPGLGQGGLWLEAASTNLCLHSSDPSQTAWFRNALTLTPDIQGPTDTSLATLVTETASSAVLSRQAITVSSGSSYSLTRIIRRGNFDWVRLTVGDASLSNAALAWFNLATATVGATSTTGSGYSLAGRSIRPISRNYCLITISFIAPGTQLNFALTSAAANASTSRADIGSGPGVGCSYDHWMTQLEAGAPTSPIIAGASTASRSADTLLCPLLPGSGTLLVTFDDGSTQSVPLSAPLPATFNRPCIASMAAVP